MRLSDLQLLRIQVDALFTHDAHGRICYVNEPGGDRAPRFFFGRSRAGNIWRCRDDLSAETVRKLEQLASNEPVRDDLRAALHNLEGFLAALRARGEIVSIESGPAYRRRGYASNVVTEWAHLIRATGRIPLYSTSWNNLASQAVARTLGLVQYGTDLCIG